jgi:hypothetical protein
MYRCPVPLSPAIEFVSEKNEQLSFSSREARRYLDKHVRLDVALQSYMNAREAIAPTAAAPVATELEKIFNKYKGVQYFFP